MDEHQTYHMTSYVGTQRNTKVRNVAKHLISYLVYGLFTWREPNDVTFWVDTLRRLAETQFKLQIKTVLGTWKPV